MLSSHARLPGSSLLCCHKACSWHILNVQWDSGLPQHTEPRVLPFQPSPCMFLTVASVHCQSRRDMTFQLLQSKAFHFAIHPVENLGK